MPKRASKPTGEGRWLLLIHQIPPTPAYLRVKISRRLAKLGAVAIKNSVYALPRSDAAREDFQWLVREIVEDGGDASVVAAHFVDGLGDAQIESLFHAARDADYSLVAADANHTLKTLPRKRTLSDARRAQIEADLARLRRRVSEIAEIDFFGSSGRVSVEGVLSSIEHRLAERPRESASAKPAPPARVHARIWVTRAGIHIDRMASAWLIRRFIDPAAKLRFVNGKTYRHQDGHLRFDMYQGEYTHEGDACSFEVLASHFGVKDPAVRAIGEVVHDLDLKIDKFGRPETPGVNAAIMGICWTHVHDGERLEAGMMLFDALVEFYRRRSS